MASAPNLQAIADRAEIHKACRALEAVVNLLNDYSEAARAVVTLQKKLAKALREAAGLKSTGQIASNALNSSANIFEVLADVETKFAKLVDKESDSVSEEVRKWFKKLAKEEKAHDDRIESANVKIKQAGQTYEKKAKKNSYDVGEEHTRYIALLTALGPEISLDKYNHSLAVNRRNTAVTYTVAATLSRVADAEWLRSIEGVRRFSPLIGQLEEWKTLCEGGWTGELPGNLPDVDASPEYPALKQSKHQYLADLPSRAQESPVLSQAPSPSFEESNPTRTSMSSSQEDHKLQFPTSLANLASFPSPPTHFPLPPVAGTRQSNSVPSSPIVQYNQPPRHGQIQASDLSAPSSSGSTALPKVAESPLEGSISGVATPALTEATTSPASPTGHLMTPAIPAAPADGITVRRAGLGLNMLDSQRNGGQIESPPDTVRPSEPVASTPPPPPLPVTSSLPVPETEAPQRSDKAPNSRSSSYTAVNSNTFKKGDYLDDREFGVDRAPDYAQFKAKSLDSQGRVDRTDTMKSSGSVVAAMRDKYTRTTGPASPPPRDLPVLPLSVATIATKYQAVGDAPISPRGARPMSPPIERSRRSYDSEPPSARSEQAHPFPSASSGTDDISHRRRRIEELEELERRETAIELRAQERERERAETLRNRAGGEYGSDGSRSPQPSFAHRPYSQASMQSANHGHSGQIPSLASRYSYSTTSLPAGAALLPPPSPISSRQSPRAPPLQLHIQRKREDTPHPVDCQCPACTVARYAESPLGVRPPEREKPKGWMRRLSMPVVVGHAFSSDSKKEKGLYGAGGGIAGGKGALGEANRSVTSFGRR